MGNETRTSMSREQIQARDFIYSEDWESLYELFVPKVGELWRSVRAQQTGFCIRMNNTQRFRLELTCDCVVMPIKVTPRDNFIADCKYEMRYWSQRDCYWDLDKERAYSSDNQRLWWRKAKTLFGSQVSFILDEQVWTTDIWFLDEWMETFTLIKTGSE